VTAALAAAGVTGTISTTTSTNTINGRRRSDGVMSISVLSNRWDVVPGARPGDPEPFSDNRNHRHVPWVADADAGRYR